MNTEINKDIQQERVFVRENVQNSRTEKSLFGLFIELHKPIESFSTPDHGELCELPRDTGIFSSAGFSMPRRLSPPISRRRIVPRLR